MAGVVKTLKFKVGDVIKVESVILTLDPSASTTAISAPAASVSAASAAATAQPAKPAQSGPTTQVSASTGPATSISVKLPELGEGVSEGELVKWLVKPGDLVQADQSIAELMTIKQRLKFLLRLLEKLKKLNLKSVMLLKLTPLC